MNQIVRISSSFSEPWVAWTMLFALIMLLLADFFQHGLILYSFQNIFQTKERDSYFTNIVPSLAGQICLYIYKLLIPSITLYFLVNQSGCFGFVGMLKCLCVVLLATILRLALAMLLGYIFTTKDKFLFSFRQYTALTNIFCFALFPFLLLSLFISQIGQLGLFISVIVLLVTALIIFIWKASKLFFSKLLDSFYIFLYLCSLEFVPIAACYITASFLVNNF